MFSKVFCWYIVSSKNNLCQYSVQRNIFYKTLIQKNLRKESEVKKWIVGDSNPGPTGYEPVALTN